MDINKYSPKFKVSSPHLLNLASLTPEDIYEYLYAAKALKTKYRAGENPQLLKNKTIALLFGNVSTRTRISFELGIRQLGGDFIFLPKDETQLSDGESVQDTAELLRRYGIDALVLRSFTDDETAEFAKFAQIPVINGLSDTVRPLQLLSDLFTMWEHKGKLENLKIAFVGDGNSTANSLLMGCAKCDMNISVACPCERGLTAENLERAMQYAEIQQTATAEEAVSNADIVYTDAWNSPCRGKDDTGERYRITENLMKFAKPDAVFMHCMPVHRGKEVSAAVADGPQSILYDQAENRLHLNKAALALLVK